MKFCNQCENMLYISVEDSNLIYHCKNCNFQDFKDCSKTAEKITSDFGDEKYSAFMSKHIKHDPTLPRVNNIACPNAQCTKKPTEPNEVIYLKYNLEDMKYIYFCCHCDNFWKLD